MMPKGTSEDESHLLEAEVENTYVHMRSIDTAANYINMMDKLVQTVVTYKVYRMNRTTRPFSEWVTVSDEAFLIICLENYSTRWRYEQELKDMGLKPPSGKGRAKKGSPQKGNGNKGSAKGEPMVPNARYTGKHKGTKKSWSKKGLKTFNKTMVRVFQDRAAHGKDFDALFMQHMKNVHEVSRKKAKKNKVARKKKERVILSDFNIEEYMAQMGEESESENESAEDDNSDEGESDEERNEHVEEV
jgi:hypothetical protein